MEVIEVKEENTEESSHIYATILIGERKEKAANSLSELSRLSVKGNF